MRDKLLVECVGSGHCYRRECCWMEKTGGLLRILFDSTSALVWRIFVFALGKIARHEEDPCSSRLPPHEWSGSFAVWWLGEVKFSCKGHYPRSCKLTRCLSWLRLSGKTREKWNGEIRWCFSIVERDISSVSGFVVSIPRRRNEEELSFRPLNTPPRAT